MRKMGLLGIAGVSLIFSGCGKSVDKDIFARTVSGTANLSNAVGGSGSSGGDDVPKGKGPKAADRPDEMVYFPEPTAPEPDPEPGIGTTVCKVYDLYPYLQKMGCLEGCTTKRYHDAIGVGSMRNSKEIEPCIVGVPNFDTLEPVDTFVLEGGFTIHDRPAVRGFIDSGYRHGYFLYQYYGLRCEGKARSYKDGLKYKFWLKATTGANFYLDGYRVVNNDGNHGYQEAHGSIMLDKGVHDFRVDFYQTNGDRINLELFWRLIGNDNACFEE